MLKQNVDVKDSILEWIRTLDDIRNDMVKLICIFFFKAAILACQIERSHQ